MKITFTSRTLAKITRDDSLLVVRVECILAFDGVGGAGGLRDLGREWGADGVDVEVLAAVVDGHVAAEPWVVFVGVEL